jgi:hypothetical protein
MIGQNNFIKLERIIFKETVEIKTVCPFPVIRGLLDSVESNPVALDTRRLSGIIHSRPNGTGNQFFLARAAGGAGKKILLVSFSCQFSQEI